MAILNRAEYATQPAPLRQQVGDLLKNARPEPIEGEILAVVVPDSNLLSAGPVAAQVYALLRGRHYETVLIVSASKSGSFRRLNICRLDEYRTPLGALAVNDRVRNELCDEDDDIFLDDHGHFHTEGIDVQLPFLQQSLRDFDIVPIVMGEETPEFCRELGNAIGEVMYNRRALVVACVDVLEAEEEGLEALPALVESRDVSRLMALLNSERVLMEGKGALIVAMIAALHRRATHAAVLDMRPPQGHTPGFVGAVLWRE